MILTLEEAKQFLKIDYEDEDSDIKILIKASELYLKNATGKVFNNTNPLAVLYCEVLVNEWHGDRSLMAKKEVSEKVRFTLQSILLQLQYSEEGVEIGSA